MDEFGVLTERLGLKPQGKSAPMSSSSRRPPAPSPTAAYDFDAFSGGGRSPSSSSFDYFDSAFAAKPSPSSSVLDDDVFGSFVSKPAPAVDGLLGGFGAPSSKLKPPPNGRAGSTLTGFDDLMPGFGSSSNGSNSATGKSSSVSFDDPFGILESTSTTTKHNIAGDPLDEFDIFNRSGNQKPSKTSNDTPSIKPPPKPGQVLKADKVKTSGVTLIDELDIFSMGGARNDSGKVPRERQNGKTSKYKEAENAARKPQQKNADDLLSSSVSSRSSSVPKSRAPTSDNFFDFDLDINGSGDRAQKASGISSGINRVSSAGNVADDLYSMLGDASLFGNFEEIQGESEERRNARLWRQQRTQDRMAKAVADMNQRDRQTQQEQEEKRIIAEQMDAVIKRWATGKQGNLRALLSSLQQVLWPECGWEPLSLTDLVTSASVKKAYRKATLCVHPDKVQQKGSTLHEKYIAEKVFDILKEAWNKFNRDER